MWYIDDVCEVIGAMMNNQEIQEYHRHRFPYLLIDCIEEIVPGKNVRGYKYFTENEWLFHCSEDENPSVPFTMVIEVLVEMFVMPVFLMDDNKGKKAYGVSADDAHVYMQIYPGDRLDVEAEVESYKRGIVSGVAKGYVDGELACSVKLKFVIPDVMNRFSPSAE
jgi:3-hydroxyacyl-[acyl-carrier-protein] dehydratase